MSDVFNAAGYAANAEDKDGLLDVQVSAKFAADPANDVTTVDVATEDVTTVDVATEDVTTVDVATNDVTTVDVATEDVTTVDVATEDVTTVDVATEDVATEDVVAVAEDVSTEDVATEDVVADAIATEDVADDAIVDSSAAEVFADNTNTEAESSTDFTVSSCPFADGQNYAVVSTTGSIYVVNESAFASYLSAAYSGNSHNCVCADAYEYAKDLYHNACEIAGGVWELSKEAASVVASGAVSIFNDLSSIDSSVYMNKSLACAFDTDPESVVLFADDAEELVAYDMPSIEDAHVITDVMIGSDYCDSSRHEDLNHYSCDVCRSVGLDDTAFTSYTLIMQLCYRCCTHGK